MDLDLLAENGVLAPKTIAAALRTTVEEVARGVGLDRDPVRREDRIRSERTQRRPREMLEILDKVEPRFGSSLVAYAWFRSELLPGFDGRAAMQLVRDGRAADVLEFVDAVSMPAFTPEGRLRR